MKESAPSTWGWSDLYQASKEFKEVGSWNWMLDSDIFGVQNPSTGEIGYCCILGNPSEVFALAFPEQFLKQVESIEYLPKEILARKEEVFQLLNPIASRLGIKLRLVQILAMLEEARSGMYQFFG